MDKNILVKIINKELTILADLLDGFSNVSDIHSFEIDLAISKVKDIYGELLLLKDDSVEINVDLKNSNASNKSESKILVELPKTLDNKKIELSEEAIIPNKEKPLSVQNETDGTIASEKMDSNKEPEVVEETIDEKLIGEKSSIQNNTLQNDTPIDESIEADELVVEEDAKQEGVEKLPEEASEVEQEEPKKEVEQTVEEEKPQESEPVLELDKMPGEHKKEIVADKFQNQTPSVNDMLAGIKKNKDLASIIKNKPIENLKTAIKINDRIWYVNELFNKDVSLYESTINELNKASDLDAALSHLFKNFNWDQNKKSTISFLELIFRRFANN